MTRPLCAGQDPDWWTPADPGASLAIAICRRCVGCPVDDDPTPHGVIRRGVAYSDAGAVIPPCSTCGRPNTAYSGGDPTAKRCPLCADPTIAIPKVTASKYRWVVKLGDRGFSNKEIGAEAGISPVLAARVRARHARSEQTSPVDEREAA